MCQDAINNKAIVIFEKHCGSCYNTLYLIRFAHRYFRNILVENQFTIKNDFIVCILYEKSSLLVLQVTEITLHYRMLNSIPFSEYHNDIMSRSLCHY